MCMSTTSIIAKGELAFKAKSNRSFSTLGDQFCLQAFHHVIAHFLIFHFSNSIYYDEHLVYLFGKNNKMQNGKTSFCG